MGHWPWVIGHGPLAVAMGHGPILRIWPICSPYMINGALAMGHWPWGIGHWQPIGALRAVGFGRDNRMLILFSMQMWVSPQALLVITIHYIIL